MDKPVKIRKPRADDKLPWNVVFAVWGTPAVFVAYQLKLFSLLAKKARSLDEICNAKDLKRRPAEAILSVTTSLGITRLRSGKYSLTPAGEDYFVETSPTYWGAQLDLTIDNYPIYSIESLKQAVMTDSPAAYGGAEEMFKSHEEHHELARKFTRTMHSASMAPASGWPGKINLAKHRVMLDVAGGSGAHSIGAVDRWPKLRTVVFDTAPVCEVASEIVSNYRLQARIGTQTGDIWKDPFPSADLHFYSMIFHDWPADKCRFLARKSFDSLSPGGRITLDKPCLIDKNNPEAASCACAVVKNLGDYVIVTSNYNPTTCTTGVISSATVPQITQVTDHLKTKTNVLTPFNIQVLNK